MSNLDALIIIITIICDRLVYWVQLLYFNAKACFKDLKVAKSTYLSII